MRLTAWAGVACLAGGLLATAPAAARDDRFGPTWWGQLGAFSAGLDSTVRVDRVENGMVGTELVLERELGLPRRERATSALLGLRFGGAWRLELEHYKLQRQARARALETEFVFDGTVFDLALLVDSEFDSTVMRASLGYAFVDRPTLEAGVLVGVHATDFRLALRGEARLNDDTLRVQQAVADKLLPLPTAGAFVAWAPSPAWRLSARADLLALKARGYRGELLHLQAQALWQFSRWAGLGAGWRHVDYDIKGSGSGFAGRVHYRFAGPLVFLEAGF